MAMAARERTLAALPPCLGVSLEPTDVEYTHTLNFDPLPFGFVFDLLWYLINPDVKRRTQKRLLDQFPGNGRNPCGTLVLPPSRSNPNVQFFTVQGN